MQSKSSKISLNTFLIQSELVYLGVLVNQIKYFFCLGIVTYTYIHAYICILCIVYAIYIHVCIMYIYTHYMYRYMKILLHNIIFTLYNHLRKDILTS